MNTSLMQESQHDSQDVSLGSGPVNECYLDAETLRDLHVKFSRWGYVRIPAAIAPSWFNRLANACEEILAASGSLRDFTMPGTKTPRKLRTVSGERVLGYPGMEELYQSPQLRALLESVAGTTLFPCTLLSERMVLNSLDAPGHTHGGHLDDPQIALLMIIEAPPADGGGLLEFIPDWRRICAQRGWDASGSVAGLIEEARIENLVQQAHHEASDMYILHASEVLHWVTPLTRPGVRRIALNLAWQTTEYVQYGESAKLLYCDPPSRTSPKNNQQIAAAAPGMEDQL